MPPPGTTKDETWQLSLLSPVVKADRVLHLFAGHAACTLSRREGFQPWRGVGV
jgi:hypothetical protein